MSRCSGLFWFHPHVLPLLTEPRGLVAKLVVRTYEEDLLTLLGVLPLNTHTSNCTTRWLPTRSTEITTGTAISSTALQAGAKRVGPDGRRLASSADDDSIRLWDAVAGVELARVTGHPQRVWRVAYSPDGKRVAASSEDTSIRLWDTRRRYLMPLGSFRFPDQPRPRARIRWSGWWRP